MRSIVRSLTGKENSADETDVETPPRSMDVWQGDNQMVHCELCNRVFVSFDIFYDHRITSDAEAATEWDGDKFAHYSELEEGEEFPNGATIAEAEPCQPE